MAFTDLNSLSAEAALAEAPKIREPRLIDKWVLWLEQRPNENGRTTALIRPWGRPDWSPQELTPFPINLRSRVHVYGGGVVATASEGNHMLMVWVDDYDQSLWFQSWEGLKKLNGSDQSRLTSSQKPKCLSSHGDYSFADGLIDISRNRWLGLVESEGRDYLVSYDLTKETQPPKLLHQPKDFAGYISLSPKGDQLVWIEWEQPSMPWQESQLWLGDLNAAGEIQDKTLLLGGTSAKPIDLSVFQPIWLPNGELLVSEDSTGWWNLMLSRLPLTENRSPLWHRPWPMASETAVPQWVYGLSTTAVAGDKILSAVCEKGTWKLKLLSSDGEISEVKQPFDDLACVDAHQNCALAIASDPLTESGLLEVDLNLHRWSHTPSRQPVLDKHEISVGEPFWFEGFLGNLTHAWYYPPTCKQSKPSPLLVKIHSGPTSMAGRGLNLGIQFWTSRGWSVLDVNYGGSTGFGRDYRERLKGAWGKVDVFDCAAAAKALAASGKADENLIAIEGGSAGGFTTLACLCFTDIFRVAACRYAVSDLNAMAKETHRFEAGYLDYLIGSLPENQMIYDERSPIRHADKIDCPVIFFQGLQDKVVHPNQTTMMAAELRKKNLEVEVYTFPEEGHGFRDINVKIKVLEATEKFFRKNLRL